MTRARDIANLVDANGDIVAGALDNVPAADVVNDTTPQLGGALDTNGNNVNFGDNDKAQFGASNDLQVYHNGGNSIVADTGTGDLYLAGDNLRLTNAALSKAYARGYNGGKFSLMYDNAEKLATTSTGVDVTGSLSADSWGSAPAGTIIQVKHFISDSEFSTSSTSFVNTGLITASFDNTLQSGSKVYATISATIGEVYDNSWAHPMYLTLYQGTSSSNGSNIGDSSRGIVGGNALSNASGTNQNQYDMERLSGAIYHTPSNTDPHYRLFMRSNVSFTRFVGSAANSSSTYNVGRTMVTIFEVAG